jgi:hypothetical protein
MIKILIMLLLAFVREGCMESILTDNDEFPVWTEYFFKSVNMCDVNDDAINNGRSNVTIGVYNKQYFTSEGASLRLGLTCERSWGGIDICAQKICEFYVKHKVVETSNSCEKEQYKEYLFESAIYYSMKSLQFELNDFYTHIDKDIDNIVPVPVDTGDIYHKQSNDDLFCSRQTLNRLLYKTESKPSNGEETASVVEVEGDMVWCTRKRYLDPYSDHIAEILHKFGYFEDEIARTIVREYTNLKISKNENYHKQLQYKSIFLDVGSNHGLFTTLPSLFGANVVAVEAMASNVEIISTSIQLNGLLDNVLVPPNLNSLTQAHTQTQTAARVNYSIAEQIEKKEGKFIIVYNAAIAIDEGTDLNTNTNTDTGTDTRTRTKPKTKYCIYTPILNQSDGILIDYHTRYSHEKHGHDISKYGCQGGIITTITLNELLLPMNVSIHTMKIDIEGFDFYALKGMNEVLKNPLLAPCTVLLELNPALAMSTPYPYTSEEVFLWMSQEINGAYQAYDLITNTQFVGNIPPPLDTYIDSKIDVIFKRDSSKSGPHCLKI